MKQLKNLKYFSTFTGIGGLDIGLEEAGAKCVGYSEIKESSIEIYKKHFPDHTPYGDITKIDFDKLPDFDILTSGFPCQSFSLAGLRKGFSDRRGQMIFHLYDLLMAKKPQFAVFENVKGLLTHNKGRTFVDIIKVLMQAGYHVRVLMLNAKYYGSAQSRERIVFLCSRDDFEAPVPVIKDSTKRFRDVIDRNEGSYKEISKSERYIKKVEQQRKDFNFELIGGYDLVGTLTTVFGCGEKVVGYKDWVRYLTPLECERLQNFPKGWTDGASDLDKYFALGNAVNANMSRYLFGEYLKEVWFKK